jgi:hypothetical protein
MELRLTYDGLLLSGAKEVPKRSEHKHDIRKQFHPQLRKFWGIHPGLKRLTKIDWKGHDLDTYPERRSVVDELAHRNTRADGYNYVPLVREQLDLMCRIDILFLRRAKPGSVYSHGDLDNRVKSLIDAMSIPRSNGAPATGPTDDEKPFYVLLEDDGLVTHLSVDTDFLLGDAVKCGADGKIAPPDEMDAKIVVTVRIKPYNQTLGAGKGNSYFV